jgi:hypothetical protein
VLFQIRGYAETLDPIATTLSQILGRARSFLDSYSHYATPKIVIASPMEISASRQPIRLFQSVFTIPASLSACTSSQALWSRSSLKWSIQIVLN